MIKLGVIGPGLIWRNMHGVILKDMQDTFKVSAFCARSDETLNKALELYPNAKCFKNADELLKEDLDAVLIALPIESNGDMAIKALKANKTLFLEKPIAHNGKLAHEIVELSKQVNKQVYVLENFAYKPIIRKLGELIKQGKVGTPIYCDMRQHYIIDFNKPAKDGYALTDWRINPKFELGCFMDGGIHYVSALTQVFGKPDSLYASGSNSRDAYGDYDHILATFEYFNSLRINFSQSGNLRGENECFKVWGSDGFLSVEKDYIKFIKNHEEEIINVTPVESHLAMWQYLEECIKENKQPIYSVEEAALNVDICDAIAKSLKEHKPEKIVAIN